MSMAEIVMVVVAVHTVMSFPFLLERDPGPSVIAYGLMPLLSQIFLDQVWVFFSVFSKASVGWAGTESPW